MTRMLKFFSILLLASLILTVILGLFVRPNTYITRAVVIESPVNVVWRHLLDYNNYKIWQKGIKKVVLNNGDALWEGAALRFYSVDYESEIAHEERVVKLENDNQISFIREGQNENDLLKDFQTTYLVKRLLDGTTELSVRISYHTTSFVTRIYNQLYLRSSYTEDCEKNLAALRKLIENS
jgi:uncharacterized membrane protein